MESYLKVQKLASFDPFLLKVYVCMHVICVNGEKHGIKIPLNSFSMFGSA